MLKLYFFKDKRTGQKRNTGIIARSITEARRKLKRPAPEFAALYKSRKLTESEMKVARRGGWVRNRAEGDRPKPSE